MECVPFDHCLIIIESLIRLIHPDHFRSVPHQRYQFSSHLLAYLKKVSVDHLASAIPPASNTAQNLAFRSYVSSDANTNRYAKSERVAHITPRCLTSDIATNSDADIIQDRTLGAAAPADPPSDSDANTDDMGDTPYPFFTKHFASANDKMYDGPTYAPAVQNVIVAYADTATVEKNNTATMENDNDTVDNIDTVIMENDHATATLENDNATVENNNTANMENNNATISWRMILLL